MRTLANLRTAGYTCCAISTLSLLHRLPDSASETVATNPGLTNIPATIRWLVSRQVGYSEGEDKEETVDNTAPVLQGVYKDESLVPDLSVQDDEFVGFNGRCNKNVDTCYAFWVTASLDVSLLSFILSSKMLITRLQILGQEKTQLLNLQAIRRFLFEQTQHRIGGFGKSPGNPPGNTVPSIASSYDLTCYRYLPFLSGSRRTCSYEGARDKTA